MTRSERLARKELRALIMHAFAREPGLPDGVARRVADRLLRQSGRLADLAGALREPSTPPATEAARLVTPAAVSAEPEPVFDPYEIGAVVTLQRLGPSALLDRLSGVSSVANLVSLATAQNLSLKAGWSNAEELRAAIVTCAEQRLAERRAAAS